MNYGIIFLGTALILFSSTKNNIIIGIGIKGFATSFYHIPFIPVILKKLMNNYKIEE